MAGTVDCIPTAAAAASSSTTAQAVEHLIRAYQTLTPQSIGTLAGHYAEQARFVDPFNDVCGRPAIAAIFRHMFEQVAEPRFVVSESLVCEGRAVLLWRFEFGPQAQRQGFAGVSHLRFDTAGQVVEHIDYWDPARNLYERVPVLGWLLRRLRQRLAVQADI